jgi:hypothetical protein
VDPAGQDIGESATRDVTSTNQLRDVQRDPANEAITARVNETIAHRRSKLE